MSKKDLIERLSRASNDARSGRVDGPDAARPTAADAVTTRVSRQVVRRRRSDDPVPEPPPPPTVVRRRAVSDVRTTAPVEVAAPEPEYGDEPESHRREEATPEPVEERRVEHAPEPEPERPAAVVVETPRPEPVPEPVVEKVRAPEPVPEPTPEPIAAAPAPVVTPPQPTPAPAATPAAPAAVAAAPAEVPDRPRYAGLGKAVVMPPPGYDPSNPHAFRREQQAAAAQNSAAEARSTARRRVENTVAATPTPAAPREDARRRGRRRQGRNATAVAERPQRPAKRRKRTGGPKAASPAPKAQKRKVRVDNVISVGQLAHELGVKAAVVIRSLLDMGQMVSITEMLDIDTASLVAQEFDYEVENVGFQEQNYLPQVEEEVEEDNLQDRPPVVTIMGHVDHGKTTLLDAIRSARVAQGEAGGITQHIGAYQVELDDRLITFIDTPGHEAFSAMRARGADVTDIVVLVVAADDGVQPQTVEAISHARAADVPIVVAVNKMDKAGVNPDNIKNKLSEHGLVPEEWGGETQFVPVSALRREGIDELLEGILLQAEVLELEANPDRPGEGQVIEAKMERGRGAVATVLIQRGTLNLGDHVVLGAAFGKVRALLDHKGKRVKKAGPSTPVELFGLSDLPEVGDTMVVVESEKNARKLAEHRGLAKRQAALSQTRRRTAEDLFAAANQADRETLLLVLKADVQGTLQALRGALDNIEVEGAEVRVLHAAVGDISESDVNLAASDEALLVGFNVNVDAKARAAAAQQGVEAEIYNVIYDVIDRVERRLKGLLAPEKRLVKLGTAEVRALFRISKVGTIAGSYVQDGKILRNSIAKVLRDGEEVFNGKLTGLKRFKDDAREVTAGYECGISLDDYPDVLEGDIIECYAEEVVERT